MAADIAAMYGVTRQAVDLWTRQPGFPEPLDVVKAGRIWRTTDVVAWAEARGRAVTKTKRPLDAPSGPYDLSP